MWKNDGKSEGYRNVPNVGSKYLPKYRFDMIKHYITFLWADMSKKEQDDWWILGNLEVEFSRSRKEYVRSCNIKVMDESMDESMSGFRPQTLPKGNLPHLSSILQKPEPLGTKFKVVACTV